MTTVAVDQRRARLRELAETDPENLVELRALTPGIPWVRRLELWDELRQEVNLLLDFRSRAAEPQQFWHHIRRGDALEIAEETQEKVIAEHLDALCGAS